MTDYFVYKVELPFRVEGITVPNPDGTYSVYINSLRNEATQLRALEHELEHIQHDHMYSHKPIDLIETEADGEIPNLFTDRHRIPLFASLRAFGDYMAYFANANIPDD